jgi:hypothetical protein
MKVKVTMKTYQRVRKSSFIVSGVNNTALGFGFSRPILPKATTTLVNDSIKAITKLKARRISPRRIPSQFLANSAQKAFKQVKANV